MGNSVGSWVSPVVESDYIIVNAGRHLANCDAARHRPMPSQRLGYNRPRKPLGARERTPQL